MYFLHLGILLQNFHHVRLLLLVLNQHTARATHILDDIDHFAEAGGGAAGLREAREAEVSAVSVFEYDEEFYDEGYGFDF